MQANPEGLVENEEDFAGPERRNSRYLESLALAVVILGFLFAVLSAFFLER